MYHCQAGFDNRLSGTWGKQAESGIDSARSRGMKYMLILYVWTQCSAIDQEQQFVIDYDLTESDCVQLQEQWHVTLDVTMSGVLCVKQQ